MRSVKVRRFNRDQIGVRSYQSPDEYVEEASTGRSYSIPHSDGSFFSDGSGYSNGPEWDSRYEIIERLEEVVLRLASLDLSVFHKDGERTENSDFLPYAREIEQDIRDCRKALTVFTSDGDVENLASWLQTFQEKAKRYFIAAAGLAGIFLEEAAAAAGKEFGTIAMGIGVVGFSLWCAGTDFEEFARQ